jgi:hypothetical protein
MKRLAVCHVSDITDFGIDSGKYYSFKFSSSFVRLRGIMSHVDVIIIIINVIT